MKMYASNLSLRSCAVAILALAVEGCVGLHGERDGHPGFADKSYKFDVSTGSGCPSNICIALGQADPAKEARAGGDAKILVPKQGHGKRWITWSSSTAFDLKIEMKYPVGATLADLGALTGECDHTATGGGRYVCRLDLKASNTADMKLLVGKYTISLNGNTLDPIIIVDR